MKNREIASFNEELVSFDVEDLTIEVLEHRFELAVAAVFDAASCNYCNGLVCSSVSCSMLKCSGFRVEAIE